ncbi:MAG: YdiU family protein [Epsilonproteobacteria bacterium]|nr:YdiU family protein [Campylobacterota bacterium]
MRDLCLDSSHLEMLDRRFYELRTASPLTNAVLVSANERLACEMGLDTLHLRGEDFVKWLNGELVLDGSKPHANAYSGHQFGYFVPNLGDGRALNLGRLGGWHLQLKGSGRTAFSRDGDGRAVLRSSIREYLASELMHSLGIATTRALAIITSDTKVYRERIERGAIVMRASSSWVRFGSFEFAYLGEHKERHVKMLADYVIAQSYPELKEAQNPYEELFFAVCDRSLEMVAHWQSVGFMHGVMNTDNMSIEGKTIDYGPYAFMEAYDRKFICNTSDYEGRYSFENQPYIVQWNLAALAHAFGAICDIEVLKSYVNTFIGRYKKRYYELMREKLGLESACEDDAALILGLLSSLELNEIDYTDFFAQLSHAKFHERVSIEWQEAYKERLQKESQSDEERLAKMQRINPRYVLKNYILEDAISHAERLDFSKVALLLEIAQEPYEKNEAYESYSASVPKRTNIRCSCSS